MRIRAIFVAACAALLTASLCCQGSLAQGQPGMQGGYSPAMYNTGGQMVDAYGNPAVIPAGYCQGCNGGGYCPPGYNGGYGGPYPGGDPYNTGGACCEQCGPHYFDVSFEFLMYQRADYGNFSHTLATLNVLPGGTPVLGTDQLSNDYESGFRIMGRYDVGALSVLEFGYTGFFDMGDGQTFVDPTPVSATEGNLFSPYTNFGQDPVGGIGVDANNFAETDRAVSASVNIETTLQTAEITYRRYWVGHNPRVTGTWLAGFRYTRLKDEFRYSTVANGSYSNYIEAENDLAGFQLGADGWVTVLQGLRIGAEGKAGVYGNQYDILNQASTSPATTVDLTELYSDEQVAFIGELRLMAVANVHPSVSIKAGYEVLFLSSIVTSVDNFNSGSPYTGEGVPRTTAFWTQSSAVFHGFHLGAEYVW